MRIPCLVSFTFLSQNRVDFNRSTLQFCASYGIHRKERRHTHTHTQNGDGNKADMNSSMLKTPNDQKNSFRPTMAMDEQWIALRMEIC